MTREEKILKRKTRAANRRARRNEKYFNKINTVRDIDVRVPLSSIDRYGNVSGSWPDPSSPTGYSQKCSYEAYGTCQSPCNGDC
jgi:hypothetical protein